MNEYKLTVYCEGNRSGVKKHTVWSVGKDYKSCKKCLENMGIEVLKYHTWRKCKSTLNPFTPFRSDNLAVKPLKVQSQSVFRLI